MPTLAAAAPRLRKLNLTYSLLQQCSFQTHLCAYVCPFSQAAMPTLAAAAPRLRKLNLAWLAMVNDWGLGQLSCLTDLQELNLRSTGKATEYRPCHVAT